MKKLEKLNALKKFQIKIRIGLKDTPLSFQLWAKLTLMLVFEILLIAVYFIFFVFHETLTWMMVHKTIALIISIELLNIFIAKITTQEIVEPLQRLERNMLHIKNKNWGEKIVQVNRHDELGTLINTLSKIQKNVVGINEEEAFFYQSVSHGLKTQIMVIRNCCMAIKDGVCGEEAMDIIVKQSLALEVGIKKLLYVTTFDHMIGKSKDFQPIDIVYLLKDCKNRFASGAEGIEIKFQSLPSAYVKASESSLRTAIENILENAIRYALTYILITVIEKEQYVEIMIENDGALIPQNTLDVLFEKFYKGSDGNFGLGLYIAKKIIAFHGGEIWADNFGNGVRFFILLKTCAI